MTAEQHSRNALMWNSTVSIECDTSSEGKKTKKGKHEGRNGGRNAWREREGGREAREGRE